MKKRVFVAAFLVAFGGISSLQSAPFGAFEEVPVAAIRPKGHLEEFLRRQADGITGHPEKLGYPFNTKLWEGPLDRVFFTEGVYNGDDEPKDCEGEEFWKSGMWWPYEQTAYQLDGMARIAQFVDAPALDAVVKRNLDWVYAHANPTNGDLFASLSASPSQWPLVVLFRAAMAYAEKHGDWDRLVRAFAANYEGKRGVRATWGGRDMLNLEGMLKVMEFTKDASLLADAKAMYARSWERKTFGAKKHVIQHGVSLSEALKLPVLLYLYTGERAYLDQAKAAVENVYEMDEQADGLFSCNEYTSGRDPRQGHETCVTADMMWTLGYFLQADGDVRMADRMERIAYNALPGSCTKDFRRHQYLSSVNQAVCGPFAQSAHFNYGESTWRQYRRAHFPQCCTGNINRSMPSFVRRMWLRAKNGGAPVAMLYGPSEFAGEQDGVPYTIVEETAYPFEDEVRFTLRSEKPLRVALRCRIPTWCDSPDAGRLVTRTLETGRTLALALPVKLTLESDRNWHWIRRGPLTLSFVPPATVTEDEPGDPFTALRITPKPGTWNYAFDLDEMKAAVASAKVEFRTVAYPFETPSLSVKLPVRRIREWQVLDEGRFMPDPPLAATPTGERAEIEFVPYATTLQRITCFPDTEPRERLATVAAYCNGELFPYDDSKPLAAQVFAPEKWTDKDFRRLYRVPPRQPDVFFDLGAQFAGQPIAGKMTYLLFRVWSDRDAERATWCLSAGYEVQAFIGGKEVYATDGMTEGLRMAPAWIDHPVKRGYNYMLVKLARPGYVTKQYPQFWGAKLEVVVADEKAEPSSRMASFADFDARANAGERLTVVFFGGSLTWSANATDPNVTGFRGLMAKYLAEKYPSAHFTFVDAAIGGTGSILGMFRLERDVLAQKPDLVFLDFSCNDGHGNADILPTCCYEYLLRKMIGQGVPVQQMFFTFKFLTKPGAVPAKVHPRRDVYWQLAKAYGTPVGDVYEMPLWKQMNAGEMPLETAWPIDAGHPDDTGYRMFADAGIAGYEKAIREGAVCRVPEKPVFGTVKDLRRRNPVDGVLPKGWARKLTYRTSLWYDGLSSRWMDDVAAFSCSERSPLTVEASGNFFGIFGEADEKALTAEVLVDDKKVASFNGYHRAGPGRLFFWRNAILDGWEDGESRSHRFTVEPIPSADGKGEFHVGSICTATIVPLGRVVDVNDASADALEKLDHARGM